MCMEAQKIMNCQNNLEKEKQSWKYHTSWFQVYYKAIMIKQYGIGIELDIYINGTE